MAGFTLKDEVQDNLIGWQNVLTKILSITSYKKFFEVTSSYPPIVVVNNPTFTKSNDRNQCHLNCREAEESGTGIKVSGWYVLCDLIYKEFAVGMCRLVHHSNLLLNDGTYVNPTNNEDRTHHIFIRDDFRHFNFSENIGYNDRMIFGDDFMKGKQTTKAVPRNKVHFACNQYYDRDLTFEKFKKCSSKYEAISLAPKNLTNEQRAKWLTLKTNVNFD